MEKEIVVSKESNVKISFKDAKIVVTFGYEGNGGGATVEAHVDADYFLDELAKAIPGQVDDAVIAVVKMAIKSL